MTNPDFRALCARMADELDHYRQFLTDNCRETHALATEARAALAKPEPVAPTDGGIPQWSEGVCGDGAAILRDGVMIPIEELVALLNRAERLARWGTPTIQPVPVSERLPGPEDCLPSANDNWCWGQERSFLSGQAAARWRMMRVSSLEDEAVAWLPHHALPTPEATNV